MTNTAGPRVFVGILNFNAIDDCIDTIRSLGAMEFPAYDVAVIDNASTNDCVARIREACPDVAMELNTANTGFAGGMNSILERAAARNYDYALLCNNDIAVERETLSRLVETARAHPEAGAVGAVEIGWTTGEVRCVAGTRHDLIRSKTHWSLALPPAPATVAFPQGAMILVAVDAVRAGLRFDDRLFMYYEEADLGFRLREMGRTAMVDPRVRVRHKADMRAFVIRNGYLQQRNRVHLVRTHGRPWQLAAHVLYAGMIELPVKFVVRAMQGRRQFAVACVRGFIDGVRGRMGRGAAFSL